MYHKRENPCSVRGLYCRTTHFNYGIIRGHKKNERRIICVILSGLIQKVIYREVGIYSRVAVYFYFQSAVQGLHKSGALHGTIMKNLGAYWYLVFTFTP